MFQKQNKSAINAPRIATLHLKIQHSLFSQQPTPPTHAHVRHRPRHPHPPSNSQNAQTRLAKKCLLKTATATHPQKTPVAPPKHKLPKSCCATTMHSTATHTPWHTATSQFVHAPHINAVFHFVNHSQKTNKQRKKAFCASHSQDGKNQM